MGVNNCTSLQYLSLAATLQSSLTQMTTETSVTATVEQMFIIMPGRSELLMNKSDVIHDTMVSICQNCQTLRQLDLQMFNFLHHCEHSPNTLRPT